jgi:flavin-dependent dehydrogenase
MTFDVIIIGGGLAGLALSIDLRKRGFTVLLIEKGSYPRHKVCGEYISEESRRYLNSLCPALSKHELPAIQRFRLSSTGNREFVTQLGLGGFGISRCLLEDLLYQQILKAGVEVMLNTKVSEITCRETDLFEVKTRDGGKFARLICNASGRRSNLEAGEKTMTANYIGVKYHVKIPRDQGLIEIHNFPGGYCGISDVEEGKSCLCYIVNSEKLAAVQKSIPELEKKILSRNLNLKKIFNEAEFIFKEPVTVSGINFLIKEPVRAGHFFLGDSAGSIAPVTGNGMSMGLRSAWVLAAQIENFFSGKQNRKELEKNYVAFWNKEFATRIKLSRYFQKLSEYPSLTNTTINIFNVIPALARVVINQTHGKPF